jgi:hypothetical protein
MSIDKLAEMALNYPEHLMPVHYNMLKLIRKHRKENGRLPSRVDHLDYSKIDDHVEAAIFYLETEHDMKNRATVRIESRGGELVPILPE